MMEREWQAILNRYGRRVTVCTGPKGEGRALRAFLQPVLEKNRPQTMPTPLGLRREERLLYLGPPDAPLAAGESRVICQGREYSVQSARPVEVEQEKIHHWWAVLRPREEDAECI